MRDDMNARVGSLLLDMAAIQTVRPKARAYTRAAGVVFRLDRHLDVLLADAGATLHLPGLGPSSMRVLAEAIVHGASPTVEHAIEASGRRADVDRQRHLRTGFLSRAEALRILDDDTLDGPSGRDYRGDLQMHSTWSDGKGSIAEMAVGCMARGYRFAAITDHAHGLPIAGGVSASGLAKQHEEIDAVNREHEGRFRLLKGVEANIRADGSLDVSRVETPGLEIVLAAPHAGLRQRDDQTRRMLRAVETPGVDILAHPRGRKTGERAGVQANWGRVFRAAARAGVAIEIDGDPSRQDIDYTLAREALDAGCLFALDSDAHSVAELSYADTALAHARLAGIPPKRIVNCWKLPDLLRWLVDRQA